MKKILIVLAIIFICFGCSKKEKPAEETEKAAETREKEELDINISFGSDTIAYATLENIKENPDEYLDKTFKMKGEYRKFYSQYSDQYYYVCIIYDATGCCSLGMEFKLDNEEDYPMEGREIIIQGTIDKYMDGTDTFLYLKDASWKYC